MRPKLDLELGVAKKDDDLFAKNGKTPGGWRAKSTPRVPPRKTLRRLGLLVLLAIAAYVFIANIPTDLGPQDEKRRPHYANSNVPNPRPPSSNDVPEVDTIGAAHAARNYDGPVRFLELAETLHAIGATKGSSPVNSNVLLMASSLKSVNKLLPFACQMSTQRRSYVHFALVSRDDMPLQQLTEINGIGKDCQIIFHGTKSSSRP